MLFLFKNIILIVNIMTVGALTQITNYNTNAANNFLEVDPQISFFKTVYRKYTRFAMENIAFDNLSKQKLSFDSTSIITANIPRNADLLKNLYFTFELPDIYSGNHTNNNVSQNYEFKWIKNIGINIFNYISIKINDQEIEKLYSDYINIWKELHLNDEQKEVFNKNIQNIPEVYDPKNGPGMNGVYPSITSDTQSQKWYNHNTKISNTFSDATFPSIIGRKVKVPIPFWFCQNSGLVVPLVALQYSQLSIEFEMKAFRDLYTIIDAKHTHSTVLTSFGKRIKPGNDEHHAISNFTLNNYAYNINPNIEGEFIFLDNSERKRFASFDHEYLITQPRLTEKDGVEIKKSIEETDCKLSGAFNPVKYITWVIKRDDMKNLNEWNNYSNWVYEDIPPYSNQYSYETMAYNLTTSKDFFYSNKDSNYSSLFTVDHLKKNILTNIRIEFDGVDRINKDADYFEKQQIEQHFKTKPKDGIYLYSFSLNPNEYQPSGCCNFSNIQVPKIYFKRNTVTGTNNYNHRAFIYIVSYNILVIKNGIGSLKFVN